MHKIETGRVEERSLIEYRVQDRHTCQMRRAACDTYRGCWGGIQNCRGCRRGCPRLLLSY